MPQILAVAILTRNGLIYFTNIYCCYNSVPLVWLLHIALSLLEKLNQGSFSAIGSHHAIDLQVRIQIPPLPVALRMHLQVIHPLQYHNG